MTDYDNLVATFKSSLAWNAAGNPGGMPTAKKLIDETEDAFWKLNNSIGRGNWLIEAEELRAKAFQEALKD